MDTKIRYKPEFYRKRVKAILMVNFLYVAVHSQGVNWVPKEIILKLLILYEPSGPLIHCRLAPSRHWYSFTFPGRMESLVSFGGNEGRTNFQILAEPGLNWGPCGQKAEILPSARTIYLPK